MFMARFVYGYEEWLSMAMSMVNVAFVGLRELE